MATEPMMPADQAPAETSKPVKRICIDVMADGTFMVGTEPAEMDEAAEDTGAPEGMEGMPPAGDAMQPAASLDEALDMARALVEKEPEEPGEAAAMKQAMAGYSKGAGQPMAAKMSPQRVFGDA